MTINDSIPVLALNDVSLLNPGSITYLIPLMVNDVSAIGDQEKQDCRRRNRSTLKKIQVTCLSKALTSNICGKYDLHKVHFKKKHND